MARERRRSPARLRRRVPLRLNRHLRSWILFAFCLSCGVGHVPDEEEPPAVAARRAALSTPIPPPADSIVPTSVAPTTGLAAGTLEGQLGVSRDGAATYAIPLWTPAGREGCPPSLPRLQQPCGERRRNTRCRLWPSTGLSQITRCKSNPFINRKHRSVQFDFGDQLCLDGEPLTVTSGAYGAAGGRLPDRLGAVRQGREWTCRRAGPGLLHPCTSGTAVSGPTVRILRPIIRGSRGMRCAQRDRTRPRMSRRCPTVRRGSHGRSSVSRT